MTKLSKTKILARRRTQSAKSKVKSTVRKLSNVQLEAQVAELEEQIALLKGEGEDQSAKSKVQSGEDQSAKWGRSKTL